jgi:HSP20 family protein
MNLVKLNNFDDAFPSLPSIFEDFFGRGNYFDRGLSVGVNVPAVNIKEESDKFLVTLAIPGIKKEDCRIQVENGMLTVSSNTHTEKEDKNEKYSRYEYNYSSFSRTFSLPDNADGDNVKAKYENGELKIELQKKEKTLSSSKEIIIE